VSDNGVEETDGWEVVETDGDRLAPCDRLAVADNGVDVADAVNVLDKDTDLDAVDVPDRDAVDVPDGLDVREIDGDRLAPWDKLAVADNGVDVADTEEVLDRDMDSEGVEVLDKDAAEVRDKDAVVVLDKDAVEVVERVDVIEIDEDILAPWDGLAVADKGVDVADGLGLLDKDVADVLDNDILGLTELPEVEGNK